MRRALFAARRLRDFLALLGVAAIVAAVWLHQQGGRLAADMAPDTRRYLADAGWQTLRGNLAGALSTRVAVAEGTTPEAVETALASRAVELGLPLLPLYPASVVAGAEDDEAEQVAEETAEFPLRSWTACYPNDIASLVALEPELLGFMPCRVNMYRDAAGRLWLATVDLELLVTGGREPVDALRREAVRVRDRILDLMAAASARRGSRAWAVRRTRRSAPRCRPPPRPAACRRAR